MKRLFLLLLLLLSLIPAFSCLRLDGEFAFKSHEDQGYKLIRNKLEFSATAEIDWVYKFKSIPTQRMLIGVIIYKKELGWIDIITSTDYVDPTKNIIYGKLKELEAGEYKIVLMRIGRTSSGYNKIFAEVEIYLYSDEDILD